MLVLVWVVDGWRCVMVVIYAGAVFVWLVCGLVDCPHMCHSQHPPIPAGPLCPQSVSRMQIHTHVCQCADVAPTLPVALP